MCLSKLQENGTIFHSETCQITLFLTFFKIASRSWDISVKKQRGLKTFSPIQKFKIATTLSISRFDNKLILKIFLRHQYFCVLVYGVAQMKLKNCVMESSKMIFLTVIFLKFQIMIVFFIKISKF